jgi:pyruvate dehydrogenase E1 component
MEGLARQIGIYNPEGQLYTPVDKDQEMYYREDKAGQIMQEGAWPAGLLRPPAFNSTNGSYKV